MSPWIETYTSKKFHLLDPQPEEICIEDIAHALSRQCRFTGHTRVFYSVAEHSYFVSSLVPRADRLWGLLHDASEAYIGDLSSPLKRLTPIGPPYREVEKRIMHAICLRFGLPPEQPSSVTAADIAMLFTEKAYLMGTVSWDDYAAMQGLDQATADASLFNLKGCWSPVQAEAVFLGCFQALRP